MEPGYSLGIFNLRNGIVPILLPIPDIKNIIALIDDDVKGKINDSLTLIEKMLSDPARSDAMRQELEEYKNEISNGDFSDSDHKYVRALYDTLSK